MRAAAIISLLFSFYTGNAWSDLSIRYDIVRNQHSRPVNSVLIKQDMVRINQAPASQPSIMINLNSGDIVQVHPQSRRYFKINAQTIGQYVSIYQKNRTVIQGLIDQGIQQLAPSKRDQVEQWMQSLKQGSRVTNNLTIQPAGKTDQVLGVKCEVLSILNQGQLQREVCVSSYQQLGLNDQDIQSLEQLKKFILQFKHSAPATHQDLLNMVDEGLAKMNGIPLKVVNYSRSGVVREIVQAGSISLQAIPPQAYRIPDDYREQSYPVL